MASKTSRNSRTDPERPLRRNLWWPAGKFHRSLPRQPRPSLTRSCTVTKPNTHLFLSDQFHKAASADAHQQQCSSERRHELQPGVQHGQTQSPQHPQTNTYTSHASNVGNTHTNVSQQATALRQSASSSSNGYRQDMCPPSESLPIRGKQYTRVKRVSVNEWTDKRSVTYKGSAQRPPLLGAGVQRESLPSYSQREEDLLDVLRRPQLPLHLAQLLFLPRRSVRVTVEEIEADAGPGRSVVLGVRYGTAGVRLGVRHEVSKGCDESDVMVGMGWESIRGEYSLSVGVCFG